MAGLYRTGNEKKELEARNGALQFLQVLAALSEWRSDSSITPQLLLDLQHRAIVNIYTCAGNFRDGPVEIRDGDKVAHRGVDAPLVQAAVEDMCNYINANWTSASAFHLSSYALWRLNWIHPFFGGNGRTSRAFSYLVLSAKLDMRLPGKVTIPDLIVKRRNEYIEALRAADGAFASSQSIDLEKMEKLLETVMADQLLSAIEQAKGKPLTPIS